MSKVTMIGCDLHDGSMVLKIAVDAEKPQMKAFPTDERQGMVAWVKNFATRRGSQRIVFAYEASGQGFGLYDELKDAGIECYVLAPTHLPHSSHRCKNKTDEKDAQMILDEVRAFVLAGRKLPAVWIPDVQTRDDREVVRLRLQLGEERTRVKSQIRHLAKRCKLAFPVWFSRSGDWSCRSLKWLHEVAAGTQATVAEGVRAVLASLVEIYQTLTAQLKLLDKEIQKLAKCERYARAFRKLQLLSGVGALTAMVFLSEIGDLERFNNRRQLAAYLGLAPASYESGERQDRKGRITRQGSARVRHVLCQASWASIRVNPEARATYERIKGGSTKRGKVAIVAIMRRLAITMWHTARSPELDEILDEADRHRSAAADTAELPTAAA
jgi:transposase